MRGIGLRIDVDTLRGTRLGVPNLVELLTRYNIRATFFFSVGPDNMGRHLWRLIRPTFLIKMMRTRATSLYGWDILLHGTIFPGPIIGKRCSAQICDAARANHEIGLHAWDHHKWQKTIDKMDQTEVYNEILKGYDLLKNILGKDPDSFAAPAWKTTIEALYALDRFPFRYESDCRGYSLFRPGLTGHEFSHIQIPITLPTYDEVIGRECTDDTYNSYLLNMIKPDSLNVLTIHAEAEGIACLSMFEDFINRAGQQGFHFVPLGDLLADTKKISTATIKQCEIAGRDGWISCQKDTYPRL
jgi:undecaprenyl phosphate-alpha-L-ara4FN deformylase